MEFRVGEVAGIEVIDPSKVSIYDSISGAGSYVLVKREGQVERDQRAAEEHSSGDGKLILGISDAAALTPYSEKSLYRIARQDPDSPFRKRSGRWGVTPDDLTAWMKKGGRGAPKGDPNPMPRSSRKRTSVMDKVERLRDDK